MICTGTFFTNNVPDVPTSTARRIDLEGAAESILPKYETKDNYDYFFFKYT